MAPYNTAGMIGFLGFGTLGVLWVWTGWRAYRAIRTGDVRSHQAWMIRNFSLTFGGGHAAHLDGDARRRAGVRRR